MPKSAGRPTKSEQTLSRNGILASALELLKETGERGLTMRALARQLGTTPMSIYHHVGSRDDMLKAMVELAYSELILDNDDAPPHERLQRLLTRYCGRVLSHADLTLAIFARPELYEGVPSHLTGRLEALLRALGFKGDAVHLWLGILVDYTHGFAVSIAPELRRADGAYAEQVLERYGRSLASLIACMSGISPRGAPA